MRNSLLLLASATAGLIHANAPAGVLDYQTSAATISTAAYCPADVGDTVHIDVMLGDGFGAGIPGIPASDIVLACFSGPTGITANAATDATGHAAFTVAAADLESASCCGDLWVRAFHSSAAAYAVLPLVGETPLDPVAPSVELIDPAGQGQNGEFGVSVALGIDVLVIGHDTINSSKGGAWVHRRDDGALLGFLQMPAAEAGDLLGRAVALTSDAIVAGEPGHASGAGSVAVWDRATLAFRRLLANPAPGPGDSFGRAAAARGMDIVIGAPGDEGGGSAWVFDGASGAQLLQLTPPVAGSGFGERVATLGNDIVVTDAGAGMVYLFDGSDGALIRQFPDPLPGGSYASALAAGNGRVLVGAPDADWNGNLSVGVVHVFEAATGSLLLTIPNPDSPKMSRFGGEVALSGTRIVVSAGRDDLPGYARTGSVYVFDSDGTLIRRLNSTSLGYGATFGRSLAADSDGVLVGSVGPLDGRVGLFGDPATGVPVTGPPASTLRLAARPTPFRHATRIDFTLPEPASRLRLSVFDVAGRRVRDLWSGALLGGSHSISWDARDRRGEPLPSGVYFIRLDDGRDAVTRKVVRLE